MRIVGPTSKNIDNGISLHSKEIRTVALKHKSENIRRNISLKIKHNVDYFTE